MIDGGRDWFWHKVKVGAIAFVVLLPLVGLFFLAIIQTFFPSVPFDLGFVAPFLLLTAIALAGRGAFLFVDVYEHKILGLDRGYGRNARYRRRNRRLTNVQNGSGHLRFTPPLSTQFPFQGEQKPRALGLKKYIKKSNGKLVDLPANTFAQRRDTSKDASTLRDRAKKKVDKIFEELELDYTLFIFVGSGWSWSK
jgi:hypothetical protein